MKKAIISLILVLVLLQGALALDAKEEWQEAKKISQEKKEIHEEAKLAFAADKTEENREAVVSTGKDLLNAVLDEAELWLKWKEDEVKDNDDVPRELKENMIEDIEANLDKIDALRSDVEEIDNQLELGIVFLKMVGNYGELLTDVARNSGHVWVHIAETHVEKMEDFEEKLRDADDENEELDAAKKAIEEAKRNIGKAEMSYDMVRLPGTPLIKFAEGNNYLNTAKTNLLSAHVHLQRAFREIAK